MEDQVNSWTIHIDIGKVYMKIKDSTKFWDEFIKSQRTYLHIIEVLGMESDRNADDLGILFLVGGLEHFLFFHILGIIIPTDFHIFQRGSNHQPVSYWLKTT